MDAIAVVLGLAIGISLGALGGGGSILTVPALVYALGEKPSVATTGSLIIVGVTALAASVGHARAGRVRWRAGLGFGFAGVASSYLGTRINRQVDPDVLLLAFSALVVIAAAAMWRRATPAPVPEQVDRPELSHRRELVAAMPTGHHGGQLAVAVALSMTGSPVETLPVESAATSRWRTWSAVVSAGLVVGFLTGLFGVGGGFVIVPALTLGLGFAMPEAIGTSLLIIVINSAAALATRAGHQSVDWSVVGPFTIAAIGSSLAGTKAAGKVSGPALTRAFAALLLAVAAYTAVRSTVGLA